MEYKIVKGTMQFIEAEVNKLIKQGWKIQGGLTADVSGSLYQAMINSQRDKQPKVLGGGYQPKSTNKQPTMPPIRKK